MNNFELKSPILLGVNSESDAEKHRFFGELSDFNIWSASWDDIFVNSSEADIMHWDEVNINVDKFKHHIQLSKESAADTFNTENIWVSRNGKYFETGFRDCENLGGKSVFSSEPDVLRNWDSKGLCDYFWLPIIYRNHVWRHRNSNKVIYKVILI